MNSELHFPKLVLAKNLRVMAQPKTAWQIAGVTEQRRSDLELNGLEKVDTMVGIEDR
jgi:hypothetical protein